MILHEKFIQIAAEAEGEFITVVDII